MTSFEFNIRTIFAIGDAMPMVNKLLSKMKGRLLLLLSYSIEFSVNQEIDIILFVAIDFIEAFKQSRSGLSDLIL